VGPASSDARVPLNDELTLASGDTTHAQLVIGTAHPADPGGLPQSLQATLGASPQPEVVSLGGASFYRYLNITPAGGTVSESIYSLPTTIGTVTAICSADTQSESFTANCERVLGTLRLTTGSVLSVGVDPGYALTLNRIIDRLNAVRRSAGSGLRAASVATRVRAAAALATAHAAAASSARRISGAGVSVANQAVVAALDKSAAAYRALAKAAGTVNVPAYGRAEAQIVTATHALNAAFAQLRSLGYRVR
jgi:hypothetical protein